MTTRTNKIIILALIILICVVLGNILIPKREHSTPTQDTNTKAEVTVDNSAGQTKPVLGGKGNETQLRPVEVSQTSDVAQTKAKSAAQTKDEQLLEEIATDIIERLQPIDWKRREFDGKPEDFSQADFVIAKRVVSRYLDNFSQIDSISFHETKALTALVDNEFTKMFIEKSRAAGNHSFDIAVTRTPLHFKMTGINGDGEEVEEIVTTVGKISSGHFGRGASWIPRYLDGERYFSEFAVLKFGDYVKENMTMDYDLPKLKEHVKAKNIEEVKYDVLEHVKSDMGIRRTYWFNKNTGMIDFAIGIKLNPKKDENPFYDATVIDYYEHDGVYYPKSSISFKKDYQVKREEHITNLVINGTSAK